MKKGNIIYYALGAYAIWYLYKKYYKVAAPATPIVQSTNDALVESIGIEKQLIAPVDIVTPTYNVKYSLSGVKYKLPQTL